MSVESVLREIAASAPYIRPGSSLDPPVVLESSVHPPVRWDPESIEKTIVGSLPDELRVLWSEASEIRLNCDNHYGQWGCILWSPDDLLARQRDSMSWRGGGGDFRSGDLIVGEFRGDCDLVVVRCNALASDYGHVLIAVDTDERKEWPCVAASLSEFIARFQGDPLHKYWTV